MKRVISAVALLAAVSSAGGGCAYGGVATNGQKAVIARNDMFLFGLLRKVYVCDVNDKGLANCSSKENP